MTSITRGSVARPRRAVAFATIAGLHALVIALIISGFARTTIDVLMRSTEAVILEEPDPGPPPPAPPQDPTLQNTVVDLGPPPLGPIDYTEDGGTAITGQVVETATAVTPVAPPAPLPIRVVGQHRLPNTDDYYPTTDIRNEVEGASTVRVCVDEKGRRSGDPTVVQSSGSASLDLGALHVLRDGRYARAMQGEQYVPNCYAFRIIFKLKGR